MQILFLFFSMLGIVTVTVRNFALPVSHYIYLVLWVQNIWELQGSRGAVTAGKETQRDLLRAADSWDNGFSAFFNMWALKNVGGAKYCRAI